MTENLCVVCEKRPTPDGYACPGCARRASNDLRAICDLAPDARLVAAGLARRDGGGSGGKPASRPPLNDGATDAVDAVQTILTTLARDIAETRGVDPPHAGGRDPIIVAARWLDAQVEWLRHAAEQSQPWAPGSYREIADSVTRLRTVVNGPEPGRFAGRCTALIDDPAAPCPVNCRCHNGPHYECDEPGGCGSAGCGRRECRQDVTARPGAEYATCRACGTRYDIDERQRWMRTQIEDKLARPVEIAGILLRLGTPIGYSTIAAYVSRGQLAPHGHDVDGNPLFRIGDVLDLRMAPQARPRRKQTKTGDSA